MWTAEMIRVFLDDLWTRFRGHVSNASAHHAPYTDAEVDAILAVHTAIINAHHDKYTDAEAITAMGAKSDTNPLHHDKVYVDAAHVRDADGHVFSVPNNTLYTLDWTNSAQVEYDYGSLFDAGHSDYLTCKKKGIYVVFSNGYWSANAGGTYRVVYLYVNTSPLKYEINRHSIDNIDMQQGLFTILELDVNDKLYIKVWQDSGVALNYSARWIYDGIWVTLLRET